MLILLEYKQPPLLGEKVNNDAAAATVGEVTLGRCLVRGKCAVIDYSPNHTSSPPTQGWQHVGWT